MRTSTAGTSHRLVRSTSRRHSEPRKSLPITVMAPGSAELLVELAPRRGVEGRRPPYGKYCGHGDPSPGTQANADQASPLTAFDSNAPHTGPARYPSRAAAGEPPPAA